MFEKLLKGVFGSKHERDVQRVQPIVDEINEFFESCRALSDDELRGKTAEFKARVAAALEGLADEAERREAEQKALEELLPEAYAAVKETCRRLLGTTWEVVGIPTTWDMVPYDVQLIGGIMLHEGRIAEMATGEGKTLVATMPLYLNALTGRGAHLVTVNDYLARRDSEWMGQIYKFLGLTVGCIQQGMDPPERRQQYACDLTYGTNNEFGFDYLRDNMAVRPEHRVQRGFVYAIVDEVDSVLVDEARTPLIISGPVEHSDQAFDELKPLVDRVVKAQLTWVSQTLARGEKFLQDPEKEYEAGTELLKVQRAAPKHKRFMKLLSDQPGLKKLINRVELDYLRDKRMHELDEELLYSIDEKAKNVDLLEKGRDLMSPADPDQFVVPDLAAQLSELEGREDQSAEQKLKEREDIYRSYAVKNERIHNIQALLKAYALYEKDVEYVVQDGKVLIVDEFTGRLMPGRRYSEGLHQAIEAKEGVRVEGETQTLATITLQNFFRMYEKLAGMTGTAETEAAEFFEIYKLDVAVIPTNKPIDRTDFEDVVYRTKREKYNAVIEELVELNKKGQPVLVGTISVEVSELLSRMLKRRGVKHHVLNAKYHQQEAEIVTQAGRQGAVTIATNMAGRGTDIKLGGGIGADEAWTDRHAELYRHFVAAIEGCWKKAQIPYFGGSAAAARARGSAPDTAEPPEAGSHQQQGIESAWVTEPETLRIEGKEISLAGRNELITPEDIEGATAEFLGKAMTVGQPEKRSETAPVLPARPDVPREYEEKSRRFIERYATDVAPQNHASRVAWEKRLQEELRSFLPALEVVRLGGLHILGTERHESRRIDRQLRGRAGRQGDPGSSRFYLSLEDDLMRLFGSDRIAGLMQRMGVQEGEVIEHGLVTRAISRAQKRVEAHNFDIRKHLLEYDNVMNEQRTVVYELRNQALTAQDMSAAVLESVGDAVRERVEKATGAGQAHRDEWDLRSLADELSFLLMTPVSPAELEAERYDALVEKAEALGERAYRARESEFTPEVLRELERHLYLYTADEHWRDHLYELDHLKGGIGLRAYGQRDPLIEYKREAYTLFEGLVHDVREDFVQHLFRVQFAPEVRQAVPRPRAPRVMQTQHAEAQAFGAAAGARGEDEGDGLGGGGAAVATAPKVRTAPRVGRNDPCPCGSGKKYKKCHMLIDEGMEPRP